MGVVPGTLSSGDRPESKTQSQVVAHNYLEAEPYIYVAKRERSKKKTQIDSVNMIGSIQNLYVVPFVGLLLNVIGLVVGLFRNVSVSSRKRAFLFRARFLTNLLPLLIYRWIYRRNDDRTTVGNRIFKLPASGLPHPYLNLSTPPMTPPFESPSA